MKIGIMGASGRMGGEITKIVIENMEQGNCVLSGVTVNNTDSFLGKDVGELLSSKNIGVKCTDDYFTVVKNSDVIIDFTSPEYSIQIANAAKENKISHVCGTTGLSSDQLQAMEQLAKNTTMFWAPNMSLAIYILAYLVEKAANMLDTSFDIEILDMHHKHKADAPSGTALMLGKAAATGRNLEFEQKKVLDRTTGHGARQQDEIGFAALRCGNIIGEHTAIFASDNEKISLSHTMYSRRAFAESAFKIALWLPSQPAGKLYNIQDYARATLKL